MKTYPEFDYKMVDSLDGRAIKQESNARLLFQAEVFYMADDQLYYRVPVKGIFPMPETVEESIMAVQRFQAECKATLIAGEAIEEYLVTLGES